jgi:hypothetical protein
VRPVAYYLAVVAMAVTILVEILRFEPTGRRVAIILGQIMALIVSLNWGVTLKYFLFIGRTDVMFHNMYVSSILDLGHVTSVLYDYQPFPLWHILNASLVLFTGGLMPADKVLAIAQGIIYLSLPLLSYLIALKLFKDQRTALLAALVSFFFPDLAYYSMSGLARAIAALLFVFLVYYLIDNKTRYRLPLIVLTTAAIVAYHSVSIIFVVLLVTTFYLLQKVILKKEERFKKINLVYIGLTIAGTAAYWFIFGQVLIEELMGNLESPAPAGVITKSALSAPISEAFNYLQYMPSVLLILLGVLVILLAKKFDAGTKLFALVALAYTALSYPGPQFLLNKLTYNFGIDRFGEYTFSLLIMVSAVGLAAVFFKAKNKYLHAFVILLFAVWVMLSISSDWVASDNPLVKREFYTYYLTQPEISGYNLIATSSTGLLMGDFVTMRYFDSSQYDDRVNMLEAGYNDTEFMRSSPEDIILVRTEELDKRSLKLSTIEGENFKRVPAFETFNYYNKDAGVWNALYGYDKVYDSAALGGYI